jgi:hypothetical protein
VYEEHCLVAHETRKKISLNGAISIKEHFPVTACMQQELLERGLMKKQV